jgi:hypothetical protein
MPFSDMGVARRVPDPRRRVRPLVGVLCGAGIVFVAYLIGVVWRPGRRVDDRVLRSAERVGAGVAPELHTVLAYLSPVVVSVGILAVAIRSARLGDGLQAVTAVALIVGSELVAQGLKLLLPRVGGGTNTLPSGHLTMIAAFVLVLATESRWRRISVALAVLVVAGSAAGTWVIGWHRPSDSVAACGVVALCWGATRLVAGAVSPGHDREAGSEPPRELADQPTVPSMRRSVSFALLIRTT